MLTQIWARKLTLMAACLLVGACYADVTLVDNGVPKTTIVVMKGALTASTEIAPYEGRTVQPAAKKIARAARDLQTYIEKISGARIPIVGDDLTAPQGNLILVGRSELTKNFDEQIPEGLTTEFKEEGYLIQAQGNRLLLAGNDTGPYHGTEYATYAFLNSLGIRWYMPGDFGEFVPKIATIRVDYKKIVSKPDFKLRNWWSPMSSDQMVGEYIWKIRNGMQPTDLIMYPADGSVRDVLPPIEQLNDPALAKVFGKKHDGTRSDGMPNLSSRESVLYAAEKVKQYFREHPNEKSFGMAPDDGTPVDFTPETVKKNMGMVDISGQVGSIAGLGTSDEWLNWVQEVAREVYMEFPDHVLTTNGYANRNAPPTYIKSDPKIWIMFAAIWSDTMHAYDNPRSWQTLRQGKMIETWAKKYHNVFMYNYIYYMLAGCGAPISLSRKTAHDMPLYKKWGIAGFADEGRTNRGESGIFPTYLRARMMWDVNLDVNKEKKEFFTNWYGPAAKPAMAFWEDLENTFETTNVIGHEDRILPYVYSRKLVDRLEKNIKKAEALATDPLIQQHVLADRVTLEHLKAYMEMNRAEFDGNFAEAARQAQRMVDIRKPATKLSIFYFNPDPDTGESYGYYYWGSVQRRDYYQIVADAVSGKTGDLVAMFPEKAKATLDPRDDGRYELWYAPEYQAGNWAEILTTKPFYLQLPGGQDEKGYPYLGALWYRMDVNVPVSAKGKTVHLYVPTVEAEAWVWVNGQYVGHREYHDTYERPTNDMEVDVTGALIPGKTNTVVFRVSTGTNAPAMADGMQSRAFFYTPFDKSIQEVR